jgi:hypothetical protein
MINPPVMSLESIVVAVVIVSEPVYGVSVTPVSAQPVVDGEGKRPETTDTTPLAFDAVLAFPAIPTERLSRVALALDAVGLFPAKKMS